MENNEKKILKVEEKLDIVIKSKDMSLRELAEEYNLHHSTVAEILEESKKVLQKHWQDKSKRIGRPKKVKNTQEKKVEELEAEVKAKEKELALKSMRIDWLNLQLSWAKEREQEFNIPTLKHLKKKEKIAIVTLAENHEKRYLHITKRKRLSCLSLSEHQYKNIVSGLRDRLRRESAIPDEDIEEVIKQIIDWPTIGGQKGSLKLGHDEKALIGSTNYTEIKKELKEVISAEVRRRQEESLLQKYEIQRTSKTEGFHRIRATKPNDIWAIDFLNVKFLGYTFAICVVYDLFTQGYCSIQADEVASAELAIKTIKEAVREEGGPPKRFILSDNGKQFLSYSYSELLKNNQIGTRFIPPGQPWFNGALESGNRDLRRLLYTIAIYFAVEIPSVARPGASLKEKLQFLKRCCKNARDKINTEIVRMKFKTTPENVKQGKVKEKQQAMKIFKEAKLKMRKERMDNLEKTKIKKHKSMEEKVFAIGKKVAASFNLDYLIAVNEVLNRRYSIIQR